MHTRLRHVDDSIPGLRRLRAGRGFRYVAPSGRPVRDRATLERIRVLAIPPAWTDVWICPYDNGHLQATGRDARGRKQYRYHPQWRAAREETKYEHLLEFGEALGRIRAQVEGDLRRPGLPQEKVLAAVVSLLDVSLIRVGNEEYRRANGSIGLTTMRDGHVAFDGSEMTFRFRGKSGKWHRVEVQDARLARIVRRCRDIPGYELFQYETGDAEHSSIDSGAVNDYVRAVSGGDFTAKDFRTWGASVCALRELARAGAGKSERESARRVVEAVKAVSERLGNTPAVCRKSYVHPDVIEAYLDETVDLDSIPPVRRKGLDADERALLGLLRARSKSRSKGRSKTVAAARAAA